MPNTKDTEDFIYLLFSKAEAAAEAIGNDREAAAVYESLKHFLESLANSAYWAGDECEREVYNTAARDAEYYRHSLKDYR